MLFIKFGCEGMYFHINCFLIQTRPIYSYSIYSYIDCLTCIPCLSWRFWSVTKLRQSPCTSITWERQCPSLMHTPYTHPSSIFTGEIVAVIINTDFLLIILKLSVSRICVSNSIFTRAFLGFQFTFHCNVSFLQHTTNSLCCFTRVSMGRTRQFITADISHVRLIVVFGLLCVILVFSGSCVSLVHADPCGCHWCFQVPVCHWYMQILMGVTGVFRFLCVVCVLRTLRFIYVFRFLAFYLCV